MNQFRHLRTRVTALLLAAVCVLGLFPVTALAAGTDTIKLESFGMSGVSYTSPQLGTASSLARLGGIRPPFLIPRSP